MSTSFEAPSVFTALRQVQPFGMRPNIDRCDVDFALRTMTREHIYLPKADQDEERPMAA